MRVGVCGIACEKCPKMQRNECPNGEKGCTPKDNAFCKISSCAYERGVRTCFECEEFPCEVTKKGPISFGFCQYLSGKS